MNFEEEINISFNKLQKSHLTENLIEALDSSLQESSVYTEAKERLSSEIPNTLTDFLACQPSKKSYYGNEYDVIDGFFDQNNLSGDDHFPTRKQILSALSEAWSNERDDLGLSDKVINRINSSHNLNAPYDMYANVSSSMMRLDNNISSHYYNYVNNTFLLNPPEDISRYHQSLTDIIQPNLELIASTPDITTKIQQERHEKERHEIFNSLMKNDQLLVSHSQRATFDERERQSRGL